MTRDKVLVSSIDLFRQIDDVDFSDKELHIIEVLSRHISLKLNQLLDADVHAVPATSLRVELATRYELTTRECDVVLEVVEGLLDAEVAEKLCITPSTLKKHIHNVYHKMGIRNRTQLYAIVQNALHSAPR